MGLISPDFSIYSAFSETNLLRVWVCVEREAFWIEIWIDIRNGVHDFKECGTDVTVDQFGIWSTDQPCYCPVLIL